MRVNSDLLEHCDETGVPLLDGVPFTGVECVYYGNGQLEEENTFVDGRRSGPSKSWYESGAARSEAYYEKDWGTGPFREWHENGHLKRAGTFDHSIFTEYQVWDERGQLVEEYRMQTGDPLHQHLQFLKRLEKRTDPNRRRRRAT